MTSDANSPGLDSTKADSGSLFGRVQRELILISMLSLFCELMIIRWLATEMRIFAYFKNLPLMAAFLGLGLGFMWTHRKSDWMRWSSLALLYFSGLLILALTFHLTFLTFVDPYKFMLFGVGATSVAGAASGSPLVTTLISLVIMLAVFALATLVFVGFGQRMGQLFEKLKPLEAYSWNVFGALLGTVLFSVLCWLNTSPAVWLIVVGLGLLYLSRKPVNFAIVLLGIVYAVWLAPFIAGSYYGANYVETVWSPYYRIDLVREKAPEIAGKKDLYWGHTVYINYDNFQQILDCSPENLAKFPANVQAKMRSSFESSYGLFGKPPEDVLILGAGNGSDLAGAIRAGVKHIDAVEIDPGIVALGKKRHPEHPYDSPKVSLKVMDARTFLKTSDKKYDLILFAYVDSHAAFSSLSSLRMDNYLFTQESLTDAAHHLKKDGVIVITFLSMADWLWDRHAKALAAATQTKPLGYCTNNGLVDVGTLVAGPGVVGLTAPLVIDAPPRVVNLESSTPVSTDDWPFLFLPKHEIPGTYMLPIFAVLFFGFAFMARQFKEGIKEPLNWQMFLMGMGFMMLEVRAMSSLSLLFGSTWAVNSTVISGVMVVILIANFVATRIKSKQLLFLGGLIVAALVGSTLTSVASLAQFGEVQAQGMGTVIFLLPMVFASIIFALLFKNARSPSIALAFNIIGGLVGVCLEYLSMWLGLRALGWLAIVIYASVIAIEQLRKPASVPAIGQEPSP